MDSGHLPSLIPIVTDLLKDTSPLAIGSTVVAFTTICPTRLDLLHPHYRRLCRMLLDIDVWGRVNVMELLSRYARTMLPRPTESSESDVDPDLALLLSSVKPLLMSHNSAVGCPCRFDQGVRFPNFLQGRTYRRPSYLLPCASISAFGCHRPSSAPSCWLEGS